MDLLAVSINAAVVAVVGGIVTWLGKGRFEAIDRRFDAVDHRFDAVDHRFDAVDHRFDAVDRRFEGLQVSIDSMRSDLTQVALAVGVRPRAQND